MLFDYYIESVLIFIGINIVMAISLYLPVSAGLLSLGQGGFMAIGAFVSAYLTTVHAAPFALALLAGGALAGLVGIIVGFPALRIKGIYLIILTMGFGEIVRVVFLNLEVTGGASGMAGIAPHTTLPIVAGIAALALFFCWQVRDSRIGWALNAVREDELAAEGVGINLTRIKLSVFSLGAFIAGIGGGLYAHFTAFIDPAQFGFFRSAEIFIMVLLGGMGNFLGATLGAVVYTLLPELLRGLQEWRMTFFGTLLVVMMIVRPWGLIGARR